MFKKFIAIALCASIALVCEAEVLPFPVRIGDLLGEGSFGSVYTAVKTDGAVSPYALKCVPAANLADLQREYTFAQAYYTRWGTEALPKPVKVYEIIDHDLQAPGVADNLRCMPMAKATGTLLRYMRGQLPVKPAVGIAANTINEHDAKPIIKSLLIQLSRLHDLGICHRDIKPLNILVFGQSPRITDFGSAVYCVGRPAAQPDEMNKALQIMTTQGFFCGEDYEGLYRTLVDSNKPVDTRPMDIYSFGVMVRGLLTGYMFNGYLLNELAAHAECMAHLDNVKTAQDLIVMVPVAAALTKAKSKKKKGVVEPPIQVAPPLPKELTHEAIDFINGLTAVPYNHRFTAADALKHAFLQGVQEV